MNIYVGNLAREVTQEDLEEAFKAFGQVTSVTIIKDKFTGEPRGFGFIEMPGKAEAQAAIDGMNGKELKGQPLNGKEGQTKTDRGGSGGRGGGRGGSGGRGGGFGGGRGEGRGGSRRRF